MRIAVARFFITVRAILSPLSASSPVVRQRKRIKGDYLRNKSQAHLPDSDMIFVAHEDRNRLTKKPMRLPKNASRRKS